MGWPALVKLDLPVVTEQESLKAGKRIMKHTKLFLAVLVRGAMAFGCSKDEKKEATPTPEATKTADPAPADPAPAPEPAPEPAAAPMAGMMPAHAAVITQKVKDFDKWKEVFDAHMEARKGASVLGHHISRGIDDANSISVYLPMSSTEKFEEWSKSDGLKAAMEKAGVEGKPMIHMMKPISGKPVLDREVAAMVVIHKVADFDKWKAVYDGFDEARQKAGIIGEAVNRDMKDENNVIVLHQAENIDALKAFVESEDLKKAMKEAGVEGKPTIIMVNQTPAQMY
jgi:heme-degrading monooxygenase HmoA